MALLSDAPMTRGEGGWRRWLNPRRPEGMSVWGSAGVLAASALLWGGRGALSEVWPNRCGLLRAQLAPEEVHPLRLVEGASAEGRWALSLRLPVGEASLWLPATLDAQPEVREEGGGVRVTLSGGGVEVEGVLKRVSGEAAREVLSGVAGRPWGLSADTLYLARLGLSLSARALTCDRELAEVEVEHVAALLLRGGVSAEERGRLREARLVGAEGWWLSLSPAREGEGAEERLWLPLAEASEGGRWAWEWRVRGGARGPGASARGAPPAWWAEGAARINASAESRGALGGVRPGRGARRGP
jgi:hypothetical protein